jgi:integrase
VGKLTAKQVEGLTAPGRYTDGDGLMLVVDSRGRRYWQLRYRIDGKRRDLSLGPVRMLSLREAREAAMKVRVQVRDGIDPVAQRKAAVAVGMTFAAAARAVHAEQRAGWRNGKHCDQWLATLENHAFPLIGDRPVASLTRADMVAVLSPIWLSHQETARRVLQRMRVVIHWSVGKDIRAEGIDFEIVRRALPRQREKVRHMPAIHFTQVRRFMDALAFSKATPVVRGAIELLVLTAARPGNIRFMEWDEVKLERNAWHVPAAKMKMARDHWAPLPPRATEILSAMERFRLPGSPWVFPGDKPGKPMSENTLCKAIQDMGFEATAHGFRSTFTDWARAVPYPDLLIEFQLAHVDKDKTRQAYGRDGQLALRREIMNHWAEALAGRVPMPAHEGVAMAA